MSQIKQNLIYFKRKRHRVKWALLWKT